MPPEDNLENRKRFDFPLKPEIITWFKKLVVPAISVAILIALFEPLKFALGITEIEKYLNEFQSDLSKSEDIVYTFFYEFDALDVSNGTQLLDKAGWEKTLTEFGAASPSETFDFFRGMDETTRTDLISLRSDLRDPIKRVFRFSASEDADITLDYAVRCLGPDGRPFIARENTASDPDIHFEVQINGDVVPPSIGSNNRNGHKILTDELNKGSSKIAVGGDHNMLKHFLSFSIFGINEGKDDQSTIYDQISLVVDGKIERCSIDAMLIVRDNPKEFKRRDVTTIINERLGKWF